MPGKCGSGRRASSSPHARSCAQKAIKPSKLDEANSTASHLGSLDVCSTPLPVAAGRRADWCTLPAGELCAKRHALVARVTARCGARTGRACGGAHQMEAHLTRLQVSPCLRALVWQFDSTSRTLRPTSSLPRVRRPSRPYARAVPTLLHAVALKLSRANLGAPAGKKQCSRRLCSRI